MMKDESLPPDEHDAARKTAGGPQAPHDGDTQRRANNEPTLAPADDAPDQVDDSGTVAEVAADDSIDLDDGSQLFGGATGEGSDAQRPLIGDVMEPLAPDNDGTILDITLDLEPTAASSASGSMTAYDDIRAHGNLTAAVGDDAIASESEDGKAGIAAGLPSEPPAGRSSRSGPQSSSKVAAADALRANNSENAGPDSGIVAPEAPTPLSGGVQRDDADRIPGVDVRVVPSEPQPLGVTIRVEATVIRAEKVSDLAVRKATTLLHRAHDRRFSDERLLDTMREQSIQACIRR